MGIILEARGQASHMWPLSTSALEQIERLRQTDGESAIELIFGGRQTQAGQGRVVPRAALLVAADALIPLAGKLPGGFQVRIPPLYGNTMSSVARGAQILLHGKYCYLNCWDDYWTIQPVDELREGREPPRHREAADIDTENMGTVKVEIKTSRRPELARILRDLRKALEADLADEVTMIWG